MAEVKVGDGVRILQDGACNSRTKKGELLVIEKILPNGVWVTESGWMFGSFSVDEKVIEIVPASEIPPDHVDQERPRFFLVAVSSEELTKQSIDAGAYYSKQKYKGAPLETSTIAMNSCSHGFWMGVRWAEKRIGVQEKEELK